MGFKFNFKNSSEPVVKTESDENLAKYDDDDDQLTLEELEGVTNYNQYPYGLPQGFSNDLSIPKRGGRQK